MHDDNGTPDDENDDIIVGWLVMELYDVSLFGGSVITTYFDLDGNEVQESEIDYDHVELINTETLGGIFGTPTPPESIIDKPEAKNQIPEIAARAREAAATLKGHIEAKENIRNNIKKLEEDIKRLERAIQGVGITFGFTNNGEGEIPRNNLALIRMARRNQGKYALKHKGKILSYRKEQYQLKLEIKGLNKKLETELSSEAASAKQLRRELRDYWLSTLEPGDYGSQKVYSPNGLGYTIPVLPPEPDWIKVDESEDEEWRNFWIKTLATELAFSVAFEIAIIRYADKVRLAANAANKVKLVNRCKAPKSVMGPAHNAANAAKLTEHLRQWEKYGAAGFKELQNGRIRYYGNLTAPRTPGTMAGFRRVREWDPATGAARTWLETVDHAGKVRIVRPETGGPKIHYMFDEFGNFIGRF